MGLPTPDQLLGLSTSKYTDWYPGQYDLLERSLGWYYSPARFLGESVPPGAGKTVSAILLAVLSGARTVFLTASKGLQAQYCKDLAPVGGVSVVGQNNFPCLLVRGLRADEGPCHDGMPCAHKDNCPYRVQLRKACDARLVITNYAYWLAQTNFSSGIGDFDLIVADEAHQAFSVLESHLTVYLTRTELHTVGLDFPSSTGRWNTWRVWAGAASPIVAEQVAGFEEEIRHYRNDNESAPSSLLRTYRTARATAGKLERMGSVTEDWVIQPVQHGFRFVPKWVHNYLHLLVGDVPKVTFMSAVLSHRSMDYLGVPNNGQRGWIEVDSQFPLENAPIWHLATARLNYQSDDYSTAIWVMRVGQIIQGRQDRKGIIFTVSYDRARLLMEKSRFKGIMYTHGTKDVVGVVEAFKAAPPPAVLVSPTVTTGWDFPMLESGHGIPQYGIVGKIPYPDTRDPVTKARSDEDKEWTSYLAMETLVQEVGRLNRSPSCLSEFFIIDDNATWFLPQYGHFAPSYFTQRYQGTRDSVPAPRF